MCGIIGYISQSQPIRQSQFDQMRDRLEHRGPDGFGTKICSNGQVALGHRRLSIIDLSQQGHQPMCNETASIWLTYNGEIYNFQSLRSELLASGHRFRSHTDSEVLLHGYEEWGMEELLHRLKGMFAFAIWDEDKQQLFAARDRFGIKPFYYYLDEQRFIFASEMKGITACSDIKKELNPNAIADYFIYSYIPHPSSVWTAIHKLLPAHYLIYDKKSQQLQQKKYWQLKYDNQKISDEAAIHQTEQLIQQAVREHLVSDVPVGLFLSGGYDSSTLLRCMYDQQQQVSTFTLGFENSARSEHHQATNIAKRFEAHHQEKLISKDDGFLPLLRQLAAHYDEPYATSSMLSYFYVSKLATTNHKVVLAGDGGDEAFGGYKWYNGLDKLMHKKRFDQWWQFKSDKKKRNYLLKHYYKSMTGTYHTFSNNTILHPDLIAQMKDRQLWYYEKQYRADLSPLKLFQHLDTQTFILESCLVRADLSSMMHSLEVRVPFLDHEIFEFTAHLHPDVYFKKGVKKYLIHENLKRYVGENILNMPKRGFSFQHWSALQSKNITAILQSGELVKNGLLSPSFDATKTDGNAIFHLLMLEFWWQAHNN